MHGAAHFGLAPKADICAEVLAEARRLAQSDQFGALLSQLVARASELLDDMDEILIALDPTRSAPSFAIAAKLHRELEYVLAAIAEQRRNATSSRQHGHDQVGRGLAGFGLRKKHQ
jgi:hypothetical protein